MRQNTRLTVEGLDNAKDAAEESQWAVQHTMAKGCSKWQSALSWTISGQLASLFIVYFPPGSQWCSFVCSFFPVRRSIAVVALAWSLKFFPGRTSSQVEETTQDAPWRERHFPKAPLWKWVHDLRWLLLLWKVTVFVWNRMKRYRGGLMSSRWLSSTWLLGAEGVSVQLKIAVCLGE